jgi:hypothetical protein
MSSKRAIRRRGCKSKVRHAEEGHAFAALRSLQRTDRQIDARMNVYRCGFCGGWHTGHQPRKPAA